MTLKTVLVEIEDAALDALKAAGHIFENIVVTNTQTVVAKLKTLPIATTAMNLISSLVAHAGTGESKMNMLVGALTAGLQQVQASGGLVGLAISLLDLAKEFGQSLYNDFKAAAVPLAMKAAAAVSHA